MPTPTPTPNIFILASDASPSLLPLLRSSPSLASTQDAHGYSLLHAAASYAHLPLLHTLSSQEEFHLDANALVDEDGETALFVAESVAAARILVEEFHCDIMLKNHEGMTAEEKIRAEGEFVAVADYLRGVRLRGSSGGREGEVVVVVEGSAERPLPLPPNVTVNMMSTTEEEEEDVPDEVDPVFRAKIEELAARDDFREEEGQRRLKELVTEAVRGVERDAEGGRDVRRRVE
ncbi:MAG: hypothetical protein Q9185_006941 [Variospora sp. 1 TL-2023]